MEVARGGEGARARKEMNDGERGHPDATYPPKELPCTWCDEMCLQGYTNKKKHHPTSFSMTNSRH